MTVEDTLSFYDVKFQKDPDEAIRKLSLWSNVDTIDTIDYL